MKQFQSFSVAFCLAIVCSLSGISKAQDCSTGQCFRTPVRNTVKAVVQAQPVRTALKVAAVRRAPFTSRAGYQTVTVSNYGSYGSCGGTRVNYGSSGGSYSFRGTTQTQSSQAEVSSLGIRKRKASREAILEAANKAHNDCTINSDELRAIKLACMSPRMLSKIEDLIVEKAQNSGAYSFALKANGEVDKAAIDWEAIGDFILKIAPIIFKLIELFAVLEQANPAQTSVAFADHSQNFVASMGFSGC